MRKIFLFLFAAVLSITTAMAEVVTITGDDCELEYTVEDDRALIITGTYLEQHSFELTLIGEIDLNAESFDCDMQMLKIGEYGSVAWADEGTATVTIYPAAIEITATGLFDSAGDDQNTYNLEGVLAFPKSSAGGDDIVVDNEFLVDMPNLVATMDPALTFTASGAETSMGLGTVETYLECDWNGEVISDNSTLDIPGMGLVGDVLAGTVAPVIDESIGEAGAIVSATATVYVAFAGMGTFKFTLNMTAGGSGEQEESNTVSVQVWNATLTQESSTLKLDGSMNGVAVHAEVPNFVFEEDVWQEYDYSGVSVEVGTWVEEGESDYVGYAEGDATVELDQHTVTLTGKLTSSDGTQFDVYIQGSLQPADPMTSTTLTMEGMIKSESRSFIQLEDDNYNTIEIYSFEYGDYLQVTASLEVDGRLEGYGSWKEVAGVETLVATLYDDYYTHVYYVTATASTPQMFTINSSNATYVVDAEYGDVTFRGVAVEGGEFEIMVGNDVEGQYAYGYWGETEIAATEITDFELDSWDNSYMLGGIFKDGANNIYEVFINAYEPDYTRDVTSGDWGTICLPYASRILTGATFYEVSSLDPAEGLWLDQLAAGAQLEAGKPYIFQATAAQIAVVYTGEAVDGPVAGANGLTGTFTGIAAGGLTGNYIIAENKVWVAGTGATLPANCAYISSTVPTTAQAEIPGRRRVCMGENATTGLDQIVAPAGQAVKAIENDQLIIIRDGVKYNVQGQVIR